MILKIEGKFYISKSGVCSDDCVFFKNKQCAPYKFSRCIDENGSCNWELLIDKDIENIKRSIEKSCWNCAIGKSKEGCPNPNTSFFSPCGNWKFR